MDTSTHAHAHAHTHTYTRTHAHTHTHARMKIWTLTRTYKYLRTAWIHSNVVTKEECSVLVAVKDIKFYFYIEFVFLKRAIRKNAGPIHWKRRTGEALKTGPPCKTVPWTLFHNRCLCWCCWLVTFITPFSHTCSRTSQLKQSNKQQHNKATNNSTTKHHIKKNSRN